MREKYEEAAAEVTASHRQLEALLTAVSSLERRLVEHQGKDAEVCSYLALASSMAATSLCTDGVAVLST